MKPNRILKAMLKNAKPKPTKVIIRCDTAEIATWIAVEARYLEGVFDCVVLPEGDRDPYVDSRLKKAAPKIGRKKR